MNEGESKSILAIPPKLLRESDLETFSSTLSFLESKYEIAWIDPLSSIDTLSFEAYTQDWLNYIEDAIEQYDVFIGFSLGALLLQHALPLFSRQKKKIILLSAPSMVDSPLRHKLSLALDLLETDQVKQAIDLLHQYILPGKHSEFSLQSGETWAYIKNRLSFGLRYVLENKWTDRVKQSDTAYCQMVGEDSLLVTKNNVLQTSALSLKVIPHAGMRILEDNPSYAQQVIEEWINDK